MEKLQTGIEAKLKLKAEGIDISYWESLISQVIRVLQFIAFLMLVECILQVLTV